MKYEFITLDNEFKNNTNNIYKNDNDSCINLTTLFNMNRKIKYPVAIFINGVLLRSDYYKFENKVITINEDFPIYSTDRIYIIFTSSSVTDSGYILQYKLHDFSVLDDTTITLLEPIVLESNKEAIAAIVNGVLYSSELFSIKNKNMSFSKYRPDTNDELSILILKK